MSIHRHAPKRDANEGEIVQTLRAVGASVEQLSARGCPDLLVGFRGVTYLIEVKMPKGKLTDDQEIWHGLWRGAPVYVVRSADDALQVIGAV